MRGIRILGWAIAGLGLAQLALYAVWWRRGRAEFFYFDPRIGFMLIEEVMGRRAVSPPTLLHWLSGFWQFGLGLAVATQPRMLGAYLMSEAALALPSLAFFAMVVRANLSPAHAFSIGELPLPMSVFLIFSAVPWIAGLKLRSQKRRGESVGGRRG